MGSAASPRPCSMSCSRRLPHTQDLVAAVQAAMDESGGRFAPYVECGVRAIWQARSIQPRWDSDVQHVPVSRVGGLGSAPIEFVLLSQPPARS